MSQWEDYTYNNTQSFEEGSSSSTVELVIGSILTIWIIVVNIILICAILFTRSLRERCSNWLLVNLAVADLFVGIVVTSFTSYTRGHDLQWELSHHMCVFWLLVDVLLSCVSMYMLIMINVDRLVYITYPSQYPRKMKKPVVLVLLSLSWIVSLCIVLPFFFNGRKDGFSIMDNVEMSEMCYIELLPRYSIATSITAFILPGACLIAINALAFRATSLKMREHERRTAVVSDSNEADQEEQSNETSAIKRLKRVVLVLCTANAIYIIMWLPFFFVNILNSAGVYHALSPVTFDVVIWLAYANSGVNPLVWLLYPEIKTAFMNIVKCKFDRNKQGIYLDDGLEDELAGNEAT